GGDRSGDWRPDDPALHDRRGLRAHAKPPHRRGPASRRYRAGAGRRAPGRGRLRRERTEHERDAARLRVADGLGGAEARGGARRAIGSEHPARHEGNGGGRRDGRLGGDLERGGRRPGAARRHRGPPAVHRATACRGAPRRGRGQALTVDATDLCFTPAVELAELIRRRALSPVEITRAVLERIERLNPRLSAYVLVHAERALGEARAAEQAVMAGRALGRLHGVPVSIKDNLWTAGERTTYGSRLMADFVAPEDAPSVAGLRAAGAILIGRTNLPEFAWRGSTDNPLFGETRNPWDLTRTPGGSTGGGAAAVAAGLTPLALGSDGAGSIRIPASFCGLVGPKPTVGRVPMYPAAGGNELVAPRCPLPRTVRH